MSKNNILILYEILVPTAVDGKPVKIQHHQEWDKYVRKISGGLTILKPARGQWVYKDEIYEERMIPVRIGCTRKQLNEIMAFTVKHYKQIAVIAYKISDDIIYRFKD